MTLSIIEDKITAPPQRKETVMPTPGPDQNFGRKASKQSISIARRDAKWLHAIAEHKQAKALSDLFEVYGPKLKGWLMTRGVESGTAEDIVQDIMIKVWTKAHSFDPSKASFATWVYRMTRNRWIDHKRKHGRMDIRDPELMKIIADDEVPSAEYNFMEQENSQILKDQIARLSAPQQTAIRLAFMEFKTHKEIATEIGVPLGTVKTRLRSAIQILKSNMARHMETMR